MRWGIKARGDPIQVEHRVDKHHTVSEKGPYEYFPMERAVARDQATYRQYSHCSILESFKLGMVHDDRYEW